MHENNYSEADNLVISEEVIAAIALNAAKDVEGVSSFLTKKTDVFGTVDVLPKLTVGDGLLKNIKIDSTETEISIKISVIIKSGVKIQNVSYELQKVIKNAVQSMTGKVVSSVDVIIAGIDLSNTSQVEIDK